MSNEKYYNFDRIRSYNKMYNMIVGGGLCGAEPLAAVPRLQGGGGAIAQRGHCARARVHGAGHAEQFGPDADADRPLLRLCQRGALLHGFSPGLRPDADGVSPRPPGSRRPGPEGMTEGTRETKETRRLRYFLGAIAPPQAAEGAQFCKLPPETRACRKAVARGVQGKYQRTCV